MKNKYVKKRNYFVFIIHRVNKHGVSRRWFTEAYVKNNHKYNQEYGKLKKRIHLQVYFKDFVHRYRTAF